MKLLKPTFWPKLLIALLVLVEFGGLIVGLLYLLNVVAIEQNNEVTRAVIVVLFLANVGASVYVINTHVPDVYKITWLFFVNALPILGLVFYIVFGNKQTSRSQKKRYVKWSKFVQRHVTSEVIMERLEQERPQYLPLVRYIEKSAKDGAYDHSSVEYFPLGDDAFPHLIEDLKKAEHYIYLEFFIITPGKFWNSILDVLKEKAAKGVDVRVMYDDVGCLTTLPSHYDRYLRSLGIQCYPFEPFRPLVDIRMNNRDHRKILVIDGHTCYTGGCNLADEYINAEVRFGHWKDNMIRIRGNAVFGFTSMFLSYWQSITNGKEELNLEAYRPEVYMNEIGGLPETQGLVQPYGDLPYDGHAVGESVYIRLIQNARRYIYISTPYLLLDSAVIDALTAAAHSGVDVHLLLPHVPDKTTVFHMSRSFYGPLLKSGCHIHEYTPGFVHAKTFVVDDEIATVGTINLDYRSLYLHSECGTLLIGAPCIADMKQDFIDTFAKSEEITMERWENWHTRHMSYWALFRILAPLM